MKKAIIISILFLAVQARAQEFSLHIRYFINGANSPNRTVIFGFDATASDSLTDGIKWFSTEFPGGEQEYPSDPFGDIDCRWGGQVINRPYLGTGGPIDIRRRPAGESFQLPFELDIKSFGASSVKITWDKSQIPTIIKHIFLSSGVFPNKPRLDMTAQSEFTLPIKDSSGLYDRMVFTVLYNKDILGVGRNDYLANGVTVYPSLLTSGTPLSVWTEKDDAIKIVITNIVGQSVLATSIDAHAGSNIITPAIGLSSGVYFADIIEASTGKILSHQKLIVQ